MAKNKFIIQLKDPEGNIYPKINNFIVAEPEDHYTIHISWGNDLDEGLVQVNKMKTI